MSVYAVTRHQGALDWLEQEGVHYDEHILHLNVNQVKPGDTVIGNLPIPMVAELNEKGVAYLHLSFTVPFEKRGFELSARQLREMGISLQAFEVKRSDF